jgi:hypothetical protein
MTSKTSRNDPCPCGRENTRNVIWKKTRRPNAQSSRASRPIGLRPSRHKAKRSVRRSRRRRVSGHVSTSCVVSEFTIYQQRHLWVLGLHLLS